MHVKGKRLALLGLILALNVICVILSGVIEMNTLFLLALAAFLLGIARLETSYKGELTFFVASLLLNGILAPNKLYCVTYGCFGLYIAVVDGVKQLKKKPSPGMLWIIKYLIFNLIYIPLLLFAPGFLYPGKIYSWMYVAFILVGQIGIFIFDKAYDYAMNLYWNQFRKRLGL